MLLVAAVAAGALFVTSAEALYFSAELLYQKGDFEKAVLRCERALRRNPRHAPAKALFTELQFLLGRGQATPVTGDDDRCMHGGSTILRDIDQALDRADRHRIAGEREAGMTELRKVREYLKWWPAGEELDARRNRAQFLEILLAKEGSTDD